MSMGAIASAPVSQMRLIQFQQDGQIRVALVKDAETVQILAIQGGAYDYFCRRLDTRN